MEELCQKCSRNFPLSMLLRINTQEGSYLYCVGCIKKAVKELLLKGKKTKNEIKLLIDLKRYLKTKGVVWGKN